MNAREIYGLIPAHKRKGLAGSVCVSVVLALLDFVGVAVLVSILLLVLDEGSFTSGGPLSRIYEWLGLSSQNSLIIAVCAGVIVIMTLKSLLSIYLTRAINRYLISLYSWFSARMFDSYISRGLLYIRLNHTSSLMNNINGVCLRFTDGVIGALLSIVTQAILILLMAVALLIYSPKLVLLTAIVFSPAVLYMRYQRRKMEQNGREENKLHIEQNKTVYETLRGYADIEINNAEQYVSRRYRRVLSRLAGLRMRSMLVRLGSRHIIELSLITGVVLIIMIGIMAGNSVVSLRVSLGVFAVAAYKIVPAVSGTVSAWLEYRRNKFTIKTISENLSAQHVSAEDGIGSEKIPFEKEIRLEGINFAYPGGKRIFEGLDITISKGERIGIRGASGTGKTTLFNIICGFFAPDGGKLSVDGTAVTPENKRMWQNNLAYVSQDVFIPDRTIAENVAFGLERDQIEDAKVWDALRTASLYEFVRSLPNGIDTVAGEAGSRISGGQRQRIGIARAIYKEASVLMFDEATSSLDDRTEEEIVRAIEQLSEKHKELTMLVISHRDHTLSFCDRTIDIDEQTVKA